MTDSNSQGTGGSNPWTPSAPSGAWINVAAAGGLVVVAGLLLVFVEHAAGLSLAPRAGAWLFLAGLALLGLCAARWVAYTATARRLERRRIAFRQERGWPAIAPGISGRLRDEAGQPSAAPGAEPGRQPGDRQPLKLVE